MCNCPTPEELFRSIDNAIDARRWLISGVSVGPPGQLKWLYTIGLSELFAHPELLVVGICCGPCGAGMLNTVGDRVAAGERFDVPTREALDFGEGRVLHVREVQSECWDSSWFAVWQRYYDTKPYAPPPAVAMQVVFPDRERRFPWEPGCDPQIARCQQLTDAPPPPGRNRAERRRATRPWGWR